MLSWFVSYKTFSVLSRNIFPYNISLTFEDDSIKMSAMRLNIKKLEAERKKMDVSMAKYSRFIGMGSDSAYYKMFLSESTTLRNVSKIAKALRVDPFKLLLR